MNTMKSTFRDRPRSLRACACSLGAAMIASSFLLAEAAAAAAPQRVFVASYGIDTNPCSRVLPCRTFATAVTVVATDGEVIPLDSAGYGPVDISRSLSIIAPPNVIAQVNATDQVGVRVGYGVSHATIRGLRVANRGSVFVPAAIWVDRAMGVEIVDCTASSESGVAFGSGVAVTVRDSVFSNSDTGASLGGGTFERVRVHSNVNDGVRVQGSVTFDDVTISGNGRDGISASAGQDKFYFEVRRSSIVNNARNGLFLEVSDGGGEFSPVIWAVIVDSTIASNGGGGVENDFHFSANGTIGATISNTLIAGNGGPGAAIASGMVNANTVAHNGTAGFVGSGQTRGNNAMLQATPLSGPFTPKPGF